MNERIKQLAIKAGLIAPYGNDLEGLRDFDYRMFAELILKECDQLNRRQSFELTGVITDTEENDGFDSVCLDTVKRVESYLANSTLKKHFGVEE